MHCWWECKLIPPLWRTVWIFLKKTRNKTTIQPSNTISRHIPEETKPEKDTCTPVFTEALFTTARTWNGEGNGKPLQYSCLENSVDIGAWWATSHGVAESDMTKRLTGPESNLDVHQPTDTWIKKLCYIYKMECYSAIKRNPFGSVLMRWMKLTSHYTKWSKSEREKQISNINAYI